MAQLIALLAKPQRVLGLHDAQAGSTEGNQYGLWLGREALPDECCTGQPPRISACLRRPACWAWTPNQW